MNSIIVSVRLSQHDCIDMEVRPDLPARDLAIALAGALNLKVQVGLRINRKTGEQVQLGSAENLADYNAWDGTEIELIPIESIIETQATSSTSPKRLSSKPVEKGNSYDE